MPTNKKNSKTKRKKIDPCYEPYNILRSIRIFAVIIILTIVLADIISAWTKSWPVMIIMLMALYIIIWSYQAYFQKYRQMMLIISVILAALLVTGMVVMLLLDTTC